MPAVLVGGLAVNAIEGAVTLMPTEAVGPHEHTRQARPAAGRYAPAMRRAASGLVLTLVIAASACSSEGVTKRKLEPLPGVTTPTTLTTLPAIATVPGATTLPGTATVPGATTLPVSSTLPTDTTLPPAASTTTVPSGPRWTFGDFRSVPQLGSEPVRGTGCGADGTIGEIIPDGWWLGTVTADGSTRLQFDLVCAYYGSSAQPLIDECLASVAGGTCNDYFDASFWPVNRNTRERAVTKSESMQTDEVADLCSVGLETRTGGITGELDWLLIENGKAVYIRRGCGSE
ncbi:MAG: hypothetical protein WCC60_07285 [Ilumatobacteraceae bacterium]